MSRKYLVLLLILTFAFVMGCSDDDNPVEPKKTDEFALVEAVGNTYFTNYVTTSGVGVNVPIATLFTTLQDGDTSNDPMIIDYRSATDFASGHIRGAVNIALSSLVDKLNDGTIPKTKKIVNVCYTGQTSSYATSFMNLLGYDAQSLSFGMCGVSTTAGINGTDKWTTQIAADEFATQLTATVSTPSTVVPFPVLSTGKTTADEIMKARFPLGVSSWSISAADVFANPGNYFIINYWPNAEYLSPGHIPGAYCYEPKLSLGKDQLLKYLPTDKTIVVYCYTGQTSAQIVAYLQMLGYTAKSLSFGMNGFAYGVMTKSKYTVPTTDYSAIIVK
jgi:rhodanese-related sulfurtransferase